MDALNEISKCNVTYHVLGETDRSAMPIGNGELAISVWVDKAGVINCYLSRTDALTELDRTVKLGLIRLTVTPNPFTAEHYCQELLIADGMIRISGKSGSILIWVDTLCDTLCIEGEFETQTDAKASYISWRKSDRTLFGEFIETAEVPETCDIVEQKDDSTLFYHKNGATIIPETAMRQGMDGLLELLPDELTGRIFGGLSVLEHKANGFALRVCTLSRKTDEASFVDMLHGELGKSSDFEESRARTSRRWNEYWNKSYIFVERDEPAENRYIKQLERCCTEPLEYTCACDSNVTRAYVLTKYMNACCNSGTFPVLYNGLLFNLCPGGGRHFSTENFGRAYTEQPAPPSPEFNPDERSWCREQLWQNVRHPYQSLLARGEGDRLKILFRYYKRFWALNRARAEMLYHAAGQHNTEMTMSFGLQSMEIYGADRNGKPLGYAQNRWGGAVDISPGLELVSLMLDYYDFTTDTDFLKEELLPYAYAILRYIETRFPERDNGNLVIGPINSVETYRDTINPTPVVAGLHSVLGRILHLGLAAEDNDYFEQYYNKIPEIPSGVEHRQEILLPALRYAQERYNVEIPELYACFPFQQYTFYKPNLELAVNTYFTRTEQYGLRRCFRIGETPKTPSYSGWQYLGVVAAILGLKEEAETILTNNSALQNPGTRFPAMWGPIYDAVPDTDHGANILNQLQKMVMQVDGDKIYLLPAFPKRWNVEFKLLADKETTVECRYADGKLNMFKITPESRSKDVVFCQ